MTAMKRKTIVWILLLLGSIACNPPSNENVLVGRHQELFHPMFIRDITGQRLLWDYANEDEAKADARAKVETTLTLIDSLHRHGKEFLFIFAPTKTAVYPEYLPRKIRRQVSDFSLEAYYIQLFKENNIPHIDFYTYFQDLKKTYPYPLFSRTGCHWAQGTMPLVGDTILRKIEDLTGMQLPDIEIIDINLTTDYTAQDAELELLPDSNPPPRKPLPRPLCALKDTSGKDRPKLLVVGDGDFVPLKKSCFVEAFTQCDFWCYNRDIYSTRPDFTPSKLEEYPFAYEMLEEADVVMGIMTAPYFYQYFFDFEETAFRLWRNGPLNNEEILERKMEEIKKNSDWYEAIVKQAQERGIPVEENLRRNALYVIQTQKASL